MSSGYFWSWFVYNLNVINLLKLFKPIEIWMPAFYYNSSLNHNSGCRYVVPILMVITNIIGPIKVVYIIRSYWITNLYDKNLLAIQCHIKNIKRDKLCILSQNAMRSLTLYTRTDIQIWFIIYNHHLRPLALYNPLLGIGLCSLTPFLAIVHN